MIRRIFILMLVLGLGQLSFSDPQVINGVGQSQVAYPAEQNLAVVQTPTNSQEQTVASPTNQSQTVQLMQQVSSLQQQVQALQGQVDTTMHRLQIMQKQQKNWYADLDQRLTRLQQQQPNHAAGHLPNSASNTSTQKGLSLSFTATNQAASVDKQSANLNSSQAVSEQANYEAAYNFIKSQQFAAAQSAFIAFLSQFPHGKYASNAHYWLGELYLQQGKYQLAQTQFDTVVKQFPKSNKVPDSAVKLGFIYYDQGHWQQALQQLQMVKVDYPNTASAQLAIARLQKMQSQGH